MRNWKKKEQRAREATDEANGWVGAAEARRRELHAALRQAGRACGAVGHKDPQQRHPADGHPQQAQERARHGIRAAAAGRAAPHAAEEDVRAAARPDHGHRVHCHAGQLCDGVGARRTGHNRGARGRRSPDACRKQAAAHRRHRREPPPCQHTQTRTRAQAHVFLCWNRGCTTSWQT